MKLRSLLPMLAALLLFVSCGQETLTDLVNSQLAEISDGKYRLEVSGCNADYYVDGGYYFDLPKLDDGLYLYYEGTKSPFPSLNFVDNREDGLSIDGLPVRDVRNVVFRQDGLFVATGLNEYFIRINDRGLPVVSAIKNNNGKNAAGGKIEFNPVEWSGSATGNYRNSYISMADTSVKDYQAGQSPRINCIKTFALYSSYEDVGKRRVRTHYLTGETVYSYFIFNIDSGYIRYVGKNKFFANLIEAHKDGRIYFVNSDDFYLRENELKGLRYKEHYQQ